MGNKYIELTTLSPSPRKLPALPPMQCLLYNISWLFSSLFQMVTRTKKIFVGGLSAPSTLEDVKNYFEQFGRVSNIFRVFSFLKTKLLQKAFFYNCVELCTCKVMTIHHIIGFHCYFCNEEFVLTPCLFKLKYSKLYESFERLEDLLKNAHDIVF